MSYRSQKAQGIYALGNLESKLFSTRYASRAHVFPYDGSPSLDRPIFARPCPSRPRHGFVDSRVVKTVAQWNRLIGEVNAAEPEAEIVCMFPIKAKWSAVLTPAGITVGPKNDGATSGKNALIIPVSVSKNLFIDSLDLPVEDARVKEFPFLELVCDGDSLEAVQLRDGPKIDLNTSYIPKRTKVKKVVRAKGDFLDWESKARTFSKGTVVWHPGGSLSSHYGIHCVLNKVPVVCLPARPKVGSHLTPTKLQGLTPKDIKKLAKYLRFWMKKRSAPSSKLAKMSVAIMHSQSQWGGENHLLSLRAFGIVSTLYLCAAAILGESRHYDKDYSYDEDYDEDDDEKSRLLKLIPDVGRCQKALGLVGSKDRKEYYSKTTSLSPEKIHDLMWLAVRDFDDPCWEEDYGGEPWRECARSCAKLSAKLLQFMKKPTVDQWRKIASHWNVLIHLEHNGGNMLDKFGLTSDGMDDIATVPASGLLQPLLWKIATKSIR